MPIQIIQVIKIKRDITHINLVLVYKGPRVGPNWSEYSKAIEQRIKLRSANILASVTKFHTEIVLILEVPFLELKEVMFSILTELKNIGVKVVAITIDQGSNFAKCFKNR
ncbi:hypothetical protein Avbf_08542 [Armadillidium vulgare]|nr:hypothetical protein Avbf_08542 [Armadillidium vulgare]